MLLFAGCQNYPTPCMTTLAEIPAIRGFKVGDRLDELSKRFPGIQPKPGLIESTSELNIVTKWNSPYLKLGTYVANTEQHAELVGVDKVQLEFLDNAISKVRITYSDQLYSADFDKTLYQNLSDTLKLSGAWVVDSSREKKRAKMMRCHGFNIQAGVDRITLADSPYVEIESQDMKEILWKKDLERIRQIKEKEKAFKP